MTIIKGYSLFEQKNISIFGEFALEILGSLINICVLLNEKEKYQIAKSQKLFLKLKNCYCYRCFYISANTTNARNYCTMFCAELFGTGLLLYLGCMGCVPEVDNPPAFHHMSSLSFGLVILLIIQVSKNFKTHYKTSFNWSSSFFLKVVH